MQVPQTHRSSLTDNADGERSETIIPTALIVKKELNKSRLYSPFP